MANIRLPLSIVVQLLFVCTLTTSCFQKTKGSVQKLATTTSNPDIGKWRDIELGETYDSVKSKHPNWCKTPVPDCHLSYFLPDLKNTESGCVIEPDKFLSNGKLCFLNGKLYLINIDVREDFATRYQNELVSKGLKPARSGLDKMPLKCQTSSPLGYFSESNLYSLLGEKYAIWGKYKIDSFCYDSHAGTTNPKCVGLDDKMPAAASYAYYERSIFSTLSEKICTLALEEEKKKAEQETSQKKKEMDGAM